MAAAIRSFLETRSAGCGLGKAIWTALRSTADLSVPKKRQESSNWPARGLLQRPKIDRKIVKAEMLQKADSPPPEAITPYRRALVVNRYKIKEARDSKLVNQTVQVAEWALLDAKVPSTYAHAKPGQVLELNLEPYEAHPQLESERLASDVPSLDEDLYYSVSSGR